jgi:hypothetical protein
VVGGADAEFSDGGRICESGWSEKGEKQKILIASVIIL